MKRLIKIITCLLVLLFVFSQFSFIQNKQLKVRKKLITSANHSSIYIYRAYYDDRSLKGTIRIFLLSKCFSSEDTFTMSTFSTQLPICLFDMQNITGKSFPSRLNQWKEVVRGLGLRNSPKIKSQIPGKITITFNDEHTTELVVERRPSPRKDRLQICVPPLYWYHDWPRMILFFELWKKHSPTFIIYSNSYSRNVGKVLKHYQDKGIVRIVNWPVLDRSRDGEDPNAGLYRLSHSLAHNDCVLRMESEIGALLDIDEYIHIPSNVTLLHFAAEQFERDTKLASLLFPHGGLKIIPMDSSFNGVSEALFVNATGPGKSVFKPDSVKYLSTHWVFKHSRYGAARKKVPSEEALLLHNRVRFSDGQLNNVMETPITYHVTFQQ